MTVNVCINGENVAGILADRIATVDRACLHCRKAPLRLRGVGTIFTRAGVQAEAFTLCCGKASGTMFVHTGKGQKR